jgi:hypothetical protein
MLKLLTRLLAVLLAGLILSGHAAHAQGHQRNEYVAPAHVQLDARYHHDHYYPAHGYVVSAVPHGSVSIAYGGGHYWYHGGVWFRASGPHFVVVAPPIGVVVPVLPPGYVSLWIGGAPYYYANDVYYAPMAGGYGVVVPPTGADQAQPFPAPVPTPAPMAATASVAATGQAAVPATAVTPARAPAPTTRPQPIVYPRNGQTPQQTEADHQSCNRWASQQRDAAADADVFERAVDACMDARGYTLR